MDSFALGVFAAMGAMVCTLLWKINWKLQDIEEKIN